MEAIISQTEIKKVDISKETHTKLKLLQIGLSKYRKINLQEVTDRCIEAGLKYAEIELTRELKKDSETYKTLMCICGHQKFNHIDLVTGNAAGNDNCSKPHCKCKEFISIKSNDES